MLLPRRIARRGAASNGTESVPYRVLIVDDERLGRLGVRARLKRYPAFVVERECSTGEEALAAIRELTPDLVFLDVRMPGMSGLEVARTIGPETMPTVIFTTAYDQYAFEAFEASAIDYLLKPLDEARFARALERARRLMEASTRGGAGEGDATPASREPQLDRFWVKTCGKVVLVPVNEVDWIAAEGDYARLHVRDRSYLINDSLTALEHRLPPALFARIHRSTIVNIGRVVEFRPHLNQDHIIRLRSGVEVRLSRTYYRRFIDVMR